MALRRRSLPPLLPPTWPREQARSCTSSMWGTCPPAYYESPGTWALDPDLRGRMAERVEEEARTRLDEQVQRVRDAGGEVAGAHAKLGRPDAEIVGLAEELGAGLIVLGSRGLGPLRSALMGSVSHSVVQHAHCPVLVVRE